MLCRCFSFMEFRFARPVCVGVGISCCCWRFPQKNVDKILWVLLSTGLVRSDFHGFPSFLKHDMHAFFTHIFFPAAKKAPLHDGSLALPKNAKGTNRHAIMPSCHSHSGKASDCAPHHACMSSRHHAHQHGTHSYR